MQSISFFCSSQSRAQAHTTPNDVSPSSWQGSAGSPTRKTASNSDPTPSGRLEHDHDPPTKRRSREQNVSPPNVPAKKHRSASPIYATQSGIAVQRESGSEERPISPVNLLESQANKGQLSWD